MNIIEASTFVLMGEDVCRITTLKTKVYLSYSEGEFKIQGCSGLGGCKINRTIGFEDMHSGDWTIDAPKLHSFEEALKALKNGKYIQRKNSYPFGLQPTTPNPIVGLEQMRSNSSFRWNDVLGNDWIIIDNENVEGE